MIFIILGLVAGQFMIGPVWSLDAGSAVLLGLAFGIAGMVAGCGLAAFIGMFIPKHLQESDRHELAALKDSVGGNFFLGTGSANNELSYFYYRKEGNAYKAEKADGDSLIFEDTENNPFVVVKDGVFNRSFWYVFAFPVHTQTEFHVPKGSVLKNYTLDLH